MKLWHSKILALIVTLSISSLYAVDLKRPHGVDYGRDGGGGQGGNSRDYGRDGGGGQGGNSRHYHRDGGGGQGGNSRDFSRDGGGGQGGNGGDFITYEFGYYLNESVEMLNAVTAKYASKNLIGISVYSNDYRPSRNLDLKSNDRRSFKPFEYGKNKKDLTIYSRKWLAAKTSEEKRRIVLGVLLKDLGIKQSAGLDSLISSILFFSKDKTEEGYSALIQYHIEKDGEDAIKRALWNSAPSLMENGSIAECTHHFKKLEKKDFVVSCKNKNKKNGNSSLLYFTENQGVIISSIRGDSTDNMIPLGIDYRNSSKNLITTKLGMKISHLVYEKIKEDSMESLLGLDKSTLQELAKVEAAEDIQIVSRNNFNQYKNKERYPGELSFLNFPVGSNVDGETISQPMIMVNEKRDIDFSDNFKFYMGLLNHEFLGANGLASKDENYEISHPFVKAIDLLYPIEGDNQKKDKAQQALAYIDLFEKETGKKLQCRVQHKIFRPSKKIESISCSEKMCVAKLPIIDKQLTQEHVDIVIKIVDNSISCEGILR